MFLRKHLLMNEHNDDMGAGNGDDIGALLSEQGISEGDQIDVYGESATKKEENNDEGDDNNSLIDSLFSENSDDEQNEDEGESSEESSDWLSEINAMDLRDQGEQFEVQSKEHLKELIQKGHNFTQKTQALADERKAWESTVQTREAHLKEQEEFFSKQYEQINEQVMENQIMENAVRRIMNDDPDLFAELQNYYRQAESIFSVQRNNPEVQRLQKEMQELKSGVETERASLIMRQFDSDFEQTKPLIAELKDTLGLEIDKEVIKKEWARGRDVKKAILAEYGDKILKLRKSKEKVEKVKRKAPGQLTGGSKSRAAAKSGAIDWSKSENDIIDQMVNLF